MLTDPDLAELPAIRHAFFVRTGGVSGGIYASLNCGFGSGDSADHVQQNRQRALQMLALEDASLVTAYQSHTADAIRVESPWSPDVAPVADGMVATSPGIVLGILTADCAPILFADETAGVIGAAHAGWRGARDGIAENTLDLMIDAGAVPSRIEACIGPCIGPESYEVSDDFRDEFLSDDERNDAFFAKGRRPGHPMFDLAAYVAHRLTRYGLKRVRHMPGDTCADADRFFSYRRSVLQGEDDYGRGLSVIALAAD